MGLGTQQALSQVKNDLETSSSDNSSSCGSSESSSGLLPRDAGLVCSEDLAESGGTRMGNRKKKTKKQKPQHISAEPGTKTPFPPKESLF